MEANLGAAIEQLRTQTISALNDTYVTCAVARFALRKIRPVVVAAGKVTYMLPQASGEQKITTKNMTLILNRIDRAVSRGLTEQAIISSVTIAEHYLVQTMMTVLRRYPKKLLVTGEGEDQKVALRMALEAADLESLILSIIQARLVSMFYAAPKKYFADLQKILDFDLSNDLKERYAEIKATRDILIHNRGYVNELYLKKTGPKARANLDERIPITQKYFAGAVTTMKQLVRTVHVGCLAKYA